RGGTKRWATATKGGSPEARGRREKAMSDVIEQFRDATRAAGLEPPVDLIADGKIHRFASKGKLGDDAGWYVYHGDGVPAGTFGDWRTNIKKSWRADVGRSFTPVE